jgi:hypothetical protein
VYLLLSGSIWKFKNALERKRWSANGGVKSWRAHYKLINSEKLVEASKQSPQDCAADSAMGVLPDGRKF